ncbi:MAG: type II toxin-antitoxin system RelE/ParE family toxin [Solirubrobacteraceae bacterium]
MGTASAAKPPPESSWEIRFTVEAERWYMGLSSRDADRIGVVLDRLEEEGPTLGRPRADRIKGSRHHKMKELRSRGGHLRALFAFDSERRAVVLVGGDKTGDWKGWYQRNIKRADERFDKYMRDSGKEGSWRPNPRRAGRRSEGRGL